MDAASTRSRAASSRSTSPSRLAGDELGRLLDRADDVVFRYRLRPTPGFEYVSRALTRITGYVPDELYADPGLLRGLVDPADLERMDDLLARGPAEDAIVLRWVRRDGVSVWVELRVKLVEDPGNIVALEGFARAVPGPSSDRATPARVFGDLRIDLDLDRLFIGGRLIHCTPSEFRLLILLTEQPGEIVSRQSMMESLWGSSHIGSGRACEAHISSLRRKVERDPHNPERIVTVRGRGYRFVPELEAPDRVHPVRMMRGRGPRGRVTS